MTVALEHYDGASRIEAIATLCAANAKPYWSHHLAEAWQVQIDDKTDQPEQLELEG
jgi:hypothetical protein